MNKRRIEDKLRQLYLDLENTERLLLEETNSILLINLELKAWKLQNKIDALERMLEEENE